MILVIIAPAQQSIFSTMLVNILWQQGTRKNIALKYIASHICNRNRHTNNILHALTTIPLQRIGAQVHANSTLIDQKKLRLAHVCAQKQHMLRDGHQVIAFGLEDLLFLQDFAQGPGLERHRLHLCAKVIQDARPIPPRGPAEPALAVRTVRRTKHQLFFQAHAPILFDILRRLDLDTQSIQTSKETAATLALHCALLLVFVQVLLRHGNKSATT